MKILIPATGYSFNAAAKTVTFSDYSSISLEGVLLITNITDNVIIYNFSTVGKGGTVTTNVLTLDYDTTGMSDTDDLQIFYDDGNVPAKESGNLALVATNTNSSRIALEIIDNFISGSRGLVTEDNSLAIKTALEVIDNFISGNRGLVTEDNSASILTSLQTIDNFISGSRGLVTEDNSAAILAKLDIALSTLRDAITGASPNNKTLNDLLTRLNLLATDTNLTSVKNAVETIDNFISGSRGLVTEDSAAAILARLNAILTDALALADNMSNPTTSPVGAMVIAFDGTTWDRLRAGLGDAAGATGLLNILPMMYNGATHDRLRGDTSNGLDVDVTRMAALIAGTANIGSVDVDELLWLRSDSFDIDNSALLVFDCDNTNSTNVSCRYIRITNAGEGDLFCRIGGSAPVADGSTAFYDIKLAKGESVWLPIGYKAATSTVHDVKVIRSAAQTNDNVIVTQFGFG